MPESVVRRSVGEGVGFVIVRSESGFFDPAADKRVGSWCEPRFYPRPGSMAGLTLVQVLRGGLAFQWCLGVTTAGPTSGVETLPRMPVPGSMIATGTGMDPSRGSRSGRYVGALNRVESKASPFFQIRSVTAAIFLARVICASLGSIRRASMP